MSACPGCGLANWEGVCPVCTGDYGAAVAAGLWPDEEICDHNLPFSVPCEKCANDEGAVNEAGCTTC